MHDDRCSCEKMSDEGYYPCPECGEPVTGLSWFGNRAPTPPGDPIAQAVPCYHRIWLPTWTPAGS